MYFFNPIADEIRRFQVTFSTYSQTWKLVLISIFSCFATIFQASRGIVPGIGFLISPLATAPILLSTLFSIQFGVTTYFLTIILIFIIEPTELIIFPFTTGLLGLGIGIAFSLFRKRIKIITTSAALLLLGIMSLLYIFKFPVLGPISSSSFSLHTTLGIFLFTFLYSWLWVEVSLVIFHRIKRFIT